MPNNTNHNSTVTIRYNADGKSINRYCSEHNAFVCEHVRSADGSPVREGVTA